jgi:hypothetical protein
MSKGSVEVRIRDQEDIRSVKFTEWVLDDLETVFSQLRIWGGVYAGGRGEDASYDLSGQFVVNDTGAYFEIIVGHGDD